MSDYTRARGRSFNTYMDQLLWPQTEFVLHLKKRSAFINITLEDITRITDSFDTIYSIDEDVRMFRADPSVAVCTVGREKYTNHPLIFISIMHIVCAVETHLGEGGTWQRCSQPSKIPLWVQSSPRIAVLLEESSPCPIGWLINESGGIMEAAESIDDFATRAEDPGAIEVRFTVTPDDDPKAERRRDAAGKHPLLTWTGLGPGDVVSMRAYGNRGYVGTVEDTTRDGLMIWIRDDLNERKLVHFRDCQSVVLIAANFMPIVAPS